MQELRLVAVSEDGTYLVLATAGRGTRFTLPVDDRLRAAVRGHFSRLGQFEIEVESPLRPKEIQARIRAGETAEEIAESAGIPVERVRWFEGPVLQEREYMAQQAQRVPVRRPGESAPGPPLGEQVEERLNRGGVDLEDVEWDSWKCEDSSWRIRLSFFDDGRPHAAEWLFDPRRRHLSPLDEVAARLSGLEWEDGSGDEGGDTVTPLLPRRPAMKIVQDPRDVPPPALAPRPAPAPGPRREHLTEPGLAADPRQAPREMTAAAPPAPAAPLAPAPPAPAALERPAAVPPHEPAPAPQPVPAAPRPQAAAPQTAAPQDGEPPADAEAEAEPAAPQTVEAEAAAPQTPPVEEPEAGDTGETGETARPTTETEPEQPAAEPEAPAPEPASATEAEAEPATPQTAEAKPEPEPEQPAASPAAAEPRPPARPAPPKQRPRRDKVPGRPAAPAAGPPVGEPPAAAARDVPVPAPATPAQQRQPAARRRKAKGKRASVPSWDEIMFGARRPD